MSFHTEICSHVDILMTIAANCPSAAIPESSHHKTSISDSNPSLPSTAVRSQNLDVDQNGTRASNDTLEEDDAIGENDGKEMEDSIGGKGVYALVVQIVIGVLSYGEGTSSIQAALQLHSRALQCCQRQGLILDPAALRLLLKDDSPLMNARYISYSQLHQHSLEGIQSWLVVDGALNRTIVLHCHLQTKLTIGMTAI